MCIIHVIVKNMKVTSHISFALQLTWPDVSLATAVNCRRDMF